MQDAWIIISHGNFNATKRLFSYDRFGQHTLPLFKDAAKAQAFVQCIKSLYNDKRDFRTNIIENNPKLVDLINLITMATADLTQIIIDPTFSQSKSPEHFSIGENVQSIEHFIKQITAS